MFAIKRVVAEKNVLYLKLVFNCNEVGHTVKFCPMIEDEGENSSVEDYVDKSNYITNEKIMGKLLIMGKPLR